MPHDRTVQDAVSQIAQEHDVSRSQARRILQEQIDLAKRIRVRESKTSQVEISNDGIHSRVYKTSVHPENPQRRHVSVGDRPKTRSTITEKQRQALAAHRFNRKSNSAEPHSVKTPTPGTLSAIIYGTLRDPEKDFNSAFQTLRAMGTRFDHLDDAALKKRMYSIRQRYGS